MKFKSPVFSQVSGSVGGGTFAHNQGGLYLRNRSIPTNPNSARQVVIRNAMKTLSAAWSQVLTGAQRAAYGVYAANVTLVNSLGDAIHVSGINMYIRNNAARIQAGLATVPNAPSVFTLPTLTAPTLTAGTTSSTGTGTITVAFTGSDPWVSNAGAGLLVFTSRPQSPGISFFKGPYALAGVVTGSATGTATPAHIVGQFATETGTKIFYRVEVSAADGGLSSAIEGSFLPG